jgi:hypothetical protein
MKNILKKILGFIIAPIFISIYFIDRMLCVVIPVVNHFDIRIWFKDEEEIRNSLIRTIVVGFIVGVVSLVKYLVFN